MENKRNSSIFGLVLVTLCYLFSDKLNEVMLIIDSIIWKNNAHFLYWTTPPWREKIPN